MTGNTPIYVYSSTICQYACEQYLNSVSKIIPVSKYQIEYHYRKFSSVTVMSKSHISWKSLFYSYHYKLV